MAWSSRCWSRGGALWGREGVGGLWGAGHAEEEALSCAWDEPVIGGAAEDGRGDAVEVVDGCQGAIDGDGGGEVGGEGVCGLGGGPDAEGPGDEGAGAVVGGDGGELDGGGVVADGPDVV